MRASARACVFCMCSYVYGSVKYICINEISSFSTSSIRLTGGWSRQVDWATLHGTQRLRRSPCDNQL